MALFTTTAPLDNALPAGSPCRPCAVEDALAARLLGGLVLIASGTVLGGWISGNTLVASGLPGLPTMKFNTALALALLAVGLLVRSWTRCRTLRASWPRWVAASSAALAGLLGALSLAQMITHRSLGIDELFVIDAASRALAGARAPGRMAPGAATAVVLLAAAVLASGRTGRCAKWIARAGAAGAGALGVTAGMAFVLFAGGLTRGTLFSTMTSHTAWLVVALGGGVLLVIRQPRRDGADVSAHQPSPRGLLTLLAAVVVTFALTLAATIMATREIRAEMAAEAKAQYNQLAERLVAEARRRVQLPVYGLKGARGVYAASHTLERLEFRNYVASHDLSDEFPGALGFGFVARVERAKLAAFVAAERADNAPDFAVTTSGDAPDLYVIKLVEPLEPNRPAWGYDMGSEPIRRALIERAVRTGEPMLSPRVTLRQDTRDRVGFVYVMAVYRNGTHPGTPEERVAALAGLMYVPIVIDEVFAGVVDTTNGNLDFEVFDAEGDPWSTLLYDHDGHLDGLARGSGPDRYVGRMFWSEAPITLGGRTWLVRTSTTPAFDAGVDLHKPALAGMGGVALSALLSGLVWVLGRSRVRALVLAGRMTADLRVATRKLERLALTDNLTGLPNRVLLIDRLTQTMLRAKRSKQGGYAVFFLDFDRFKLINDTMGHDAGDELLIQISARLCAVLRISDSVCRGGTGNTAARLGGDEFVALLQDLADPQDARLVAARMVAALAEPYDIAGQRVVSTVSIGVVIGDERYIAADDLLRDADRAMYEAKAAGKGRYVVYNAVARSPFSPPPGGLPGAVGLVRPHAAA